MNVLLIILYYLIIFINGFLCGLLIAYFIMFLMKKNRKNKF